MGSEGPSAEQSTETHRPSSELPVWLHSRAAAAPTSVAPSGSPLHTLPTLGRVPLLRSSFYLPVVPFNNQGARWYALQRRRALAGGRDGGRGVNKGFVSGACWQHTCCLKRADIRAQQDTVDGEGMEG